MLKQLSPFLLILILVVPGFPVVLTDDLQVVVPTGQPQPQDLCVNQFHVELDIPRIILQWDDRSSNIVFQSDHFSIYNFPDHKALLELEKLHEQLYLDMETTLKLRGKIININVTLE